MPEHVLMSEIGITLHGLESVERRWCDPQNLANRPDTMHTTMIIHERDHLRNGRPSSAAAKYALAFFRISLACLSSRFSRSRALIRAFSSLVGTDSSPTRQRQHV